MLKTTLLFFIVLCVYNVFSQSVDVNAIIESQEYSDSTDFFSVIVILLLVVFTLLVLERTKKFQRKNIILSKDVGISKNIAASILLFGTFANTLAHIFASRVDPLIPNDDFSTLLTGVILFALFLIVRFTRVGTSFAKFLMVFGFFLVLSHNLIEAYFAAIHPFYLASIIIVLSVTPVVFNELTQVLKFISGLIVLTTVMVLFVDNPIYNPYLFLIGIAIISLVVTLLTYIRNNSLEKLIFTSGVINKGNVLVIAFDKNAHISYLSENLRDILPVNDDELFGFPIASMNRFQPNLTNYKMFANVDLKSEFLDGKVFVSPLLSKRGEIVYYQWSCKFFSEDVRVILGQDITEKVNMERYYELIVSSADDLIFQTDPNGYFTFVNEKCMQLFGKSESEMIGKHWSFIVHPDELDNALMFYKKQFINKIHTTFYEFPIYNANGEVRWLGQNLTTLLKPGSDKWVKGYLGLARDITQRRKALSLIKEQNKNITASINYAKRIQFNMLPSEFIFENFFKEYFILFKPKDIVSGDFYWMDKLGDEMIIACVDCTGHGVPGAFMTLLGINSLNEIVKEQRITEPSSILNKLDVRLLKELPRETSNSEKINDGMAVTLINYNLVTKELKFATAGGRFIILSTSTKQIKTYRLNTKHIGDVEEGFIGYETGVTLFEEDDVLYLFTDGFPDQFGGERNKKITYDRFIDLMINSSELSLNEQQLLFSQFFKDWKRKNEQTDDVTVIGLKGLNLTSNL